MEIVDTDASACGGTGCALAATVVVGVSWDRAYGSSSGEYRSMRTLRGARVGRRAG